jgi:hypothetical protein
MFILSLRALTTQPLPPTAAKRARCRALPNPASPSSYDLSNNQRRLHQVDSKLRAGPASVSDCQSFGDDAAAPSKSGRTPLHISGFPLMVQHIGRVLGLGTKVVTITAENLERLPGIKVLVSDAEVRTLPEAKKQ